MKRSALESVLIFRKSDIGLDCYKGKESMSRVVDTLYFFWNMSGSDLPIDVPFSWVYNKFKTLFVLSSKGEYPYDNP